MRRVKELTELGELEKVEDLLSQDNLVRFHLLTILTRQGHISKVVVLFQISKSSTLSLILADFFI